MFGQVCVTENRCRAGRSNDAWIKDAALRKVLNEGSAKMFAAGARKRDVVKWAVGWALPDRKSATLPG
jgi:hypothetical protein